jgi:DNA-directed RNA polymerase subunit RPC12/RpoP
MDARTTSRDGPRADAAMSLSWRIKERAGFTNVEFFGEIDENADFAELKQRLRGQVVFHLGEIKRINSCGVREWVNFVRDLPQVSELTFTHCSSAIVTQLNMISNFRGPAKVRSFFAPYVCEKCNREEDKLLDVRTHFPTHDLGKLPEFKCEKCSSVMEFDDIPERYLAFLAEP